MRQRPHSKVKALAALAIVVAAAIAGAAYAATQTTAMKPQPSSPMITSGPEDGTTETSATFTFTHSQSGVGFECRLDGDAFAACASPKHYPGPLSTGTHHFRVRAVTSTGVRSNEAEYKWKIDKSLAIPITGDLGALLYPGRTEPLPLTFTNPYNFALSVSEIGVSIRDETSKPGCAGSLNIGITQYSGPPLIVPAKSSRTMDPSQAPQITMRDLPTNQDACKGATFRMDYTATATKAK